MTDIKRKILNDLRVELSDEFDRNFQRKAFFDRPWPPRKLGKKGSLLMVTGKLRRSSFNCADLRGDQWSNTGASSSQ